MTVGNVQGTVRDLLVTICDVDVICNVPVTVHIHVTVHDMHVIKRKVCFV